MKLHDKSVCVLMALMFSVVVPLHAQDFSKGVPGDDSDWWSIIRQIDSATDRLKPQQREPAASNFQVLGISLLHSHLFEKVIGGLGMTDEVVRGDAGTAREQACYVSAQGTPKTYLIFEGGEVQYSFYLFSDGRHWNGADHCAKSPLVTSALQTGSGLSLGMSVEQVERILGRPTMRTKDHLVYWLQVPQRTPPAKLARWRRQNPQMSDKDFHEDYDYYTLSADIEANFANSKLIYLGVDESEVY